MSSASRLNLTQWPEASQTSHENYQIDRSPSSPDTCIRREGVRVYRTFDSGRNAPSGLSDFLRAKYPTHEYAQAVFLFRRQSPSMTSRERSPQASIRNIVNTPFEDDRDVADFLETSLDYLTTGATARRSSQTIRLTTGPTSSTWPFDPQIRTASQQPSQLTIAECQRLAVSTDQPLTSPHIRHPIKEGRVQSVKIEGGTEIAPTISYITLAGSPALAHVGLTPQRQHSLGGFRVQGKTTIGALKVLEDALAVQEQGAFAVMLEAVLAEVARLVTKKLDVPTSGVGAGNGCDGQALVLVDISGNFPPGRFLPKLLKKYGDVWGGL